MIFLMDCHFLFCLRSQRRLSPFRQTTMQARLGKPYQMWGIVVLTGSEVALFGCLTASVQEDIVQGVQ
ncbi:MAG: hypothetical protein B0D91_07660 [Oceanospirillales bacterium LUC14_002_19_P2]|nr:MAG: hypothetical protein B0D91_07660 [Oceanospirillales bacterium LUC14_002_19_P2]